MDKKMLSKREAIELMHKGHKVRHRFFLFDEYIEIPWGGIIRLVSDLGTFEVHESLFWHDRKSKEWESNWEIFVDPTRN